MKICANYWRRHVAAMRLSASTYQGGTHTNINTNTDTVKLEMLALKNDELAGRWKGQRKRMTHTHKQIYNDIHR